MARLKGNVLSDRRVHLIRDGHPCIMTGSQLKNATCILDYINPVRPIDSMHDLLSKFSNQIAYTLNENSLYQYLNESDMTLYLPIEGAISGYFSSTCDTIAE